VEKEDADRLTISIGWPKGQPGADILVLRSLWMRLEDLGQPKTRMEVILWCFFVMTFTPPTQVTPDRGKTRRMWIDDAEVPAGSQHVYDQPGGGRGFADGIWTSG
jgi:hypothetical protein